MTEDCIYISMFPAWKSVKPCALVWPSWWTELSNVSGLPPTSRIVMATATHSPSEWGGPATRGLQRKWSGSCGGPCPRLCSRWVAWVRGQSEWVNKWKRSRLSEAGLPLCYDIVIFMVFLIFCSLVLTILLHNCFSKTLCYFENQKSEKPAKLSRGKKTFWKKFLQKTAHFQNIGHPYWWKFSNCSMYNLKFVPSQPKIRKHSTVLETAYFTSKPILLTKKVRSKVNFPQCLVRGYICLSVCVSGRHSIHRLS